MKLLTTPIFYVNAKPHLGHFYLMLLADVQKRWAQLGQKSVVLMTGTDEHGLKIQSVAEKERIPPQKLVDRNLQTFRDLAHAMNISHDLFMRTTEKRHAATVESMWRRLSQTGNIYKGTHKGWYCVADEAFYTDVQVTEKEGKMVSIETGGEVFHHTEENYFFQLSKYQDRLIKYLEKGSVVPEIRRLELLNELKEPLQDLSISRPSSRLSWGLDVPGDPTQKIYVWLDALNIYITAANYPELDTWPATHIVGKDIARFHCIYWPIFLMAVGIQPPEQVVVHAHWLNSGRKMSKRLGNVVDPVTIAETYGLDPFRLYLCEKSSLATDGKFSEDGLFAFRNVIINKWANLPNRLSSFNVREVTKAYESGALGTFDDPLIDQMNGLWRKMDEDVRSYQFGPAIQHFWALMEAANLYFQSKEPWLCADPVEKSKIVFVTVEAFRIGTQCIAPFMPQLAEKAMNFLQLSNVLASSAQFGQGGIYGGDGKVKLMEKLN